MFCVSLCVGMRDDACCFYNPVEQLKSLSAYDHLRRFFRICITHFKRNIHAIRKHISSEVRSAMLSLSSTEQHPDIDGAFQTIRRGGPKARGNKTKPTEIEDTDLPPSLSAWLKDKIDGSKFSLPALYQPSSLVPMDIWKASPTTTNGNEQAHRNINRNGVNLTVLGGIMRGMQYDRRATASLELHSTQGIYIRDQESTHFRRMERLVNRHSAYLSFSPILLMY